MAEPEITKPNKEINHLPTFGTPVIKPSPFSLLKKRNRFEALEPYRRIQTPVQLKKTFFFCADESETVPAFARVLTFECGKINLPEVIKDFGLPFTCSSPGITRSKSFVMN